MSILEKRRLGRTKISPTALSLGCAWIGSETDSDLEAVKTVEKAIELGINYFDTDPGYQSGKSETRLGRSLSQVPRDRYFLSTKVGTRPGMQGDFSSDAVKRSLDMSLQALGVEYLDLVLIHDPPDMDPPLAAGAALDTLVQMKRQGAIGAVGLGCREHTFHKKAIATGKLDVVLTFKDYTLLDQSAAIDIIPLAQKHGLGIILASILDMGTLSGEAPPKRQKPANRMWHWCRSKGYCLRDFAIQFGLALPIDGCLLTGPATAKQMQDVYHSATRGISPKLWSEFHSEFGISPGALVEIEPTEAG